ncbi:MAG: hypothetical protein Q4D66_04100 [Bacteroidales bacterium]|nr:hypothetical protein [Bacteroidales bacterium]
MKQHLKSILILALVFLCLAPALLFFEQKWSGVDLVLMAQQIMGLAIFYFAFTILELWVVGQLREKGPAYFVGANLGFSLLRLFCTVGLIFYFKQQEEAYFTTAFVNVLIFYFATLLFSTLLRHREDSHTK